MINEILGKISITPKGQWVAGTYERLDLVTDNGSSYLSLKDNNVSDLTVKADWMVVAEKGKAFEYSDFTPEQLEALKVKGDPFTYDDFTPEQIAELQQPAADEIASIQAVELAVEQAEELRVQAEQTRQTNTATAIQNAENATTNANNAASLANAKAGLANDAATLANVKVGLADTAATNANTKAGLADAAATNANNVANTYAAELALKEVKANKKTTLTDSDTDYPTTKAVNTGLALKEATANKQNNLNTDGTGTKFPTVDAVNARLASAGNNLIASYTHSGNKEVHCTAVDLATGTFTSVGHGLVNGDTIFPILNLGYLESTFGIIRPFPTGLLLQRYFVVEATVNTFKVSVTSGGVAVTFTSNANMDLTSWHFEKSVTLMVIISNITERNTRIVFTGWHLSAFLTITPSIAESGGFGSKNTFMGSGTTVSSNGMNILTYEGYVHIVRDTRTDKRISSQFSGVVVKPNTVSANTIAALDAKVVSLYYSDVTPTNVIVGFNSSANIMVNGNEIKIYKL